jgi:transcriptional regulator with XRE-family HTH domain
MSKLEKGASYPRLEIIINLATVLEVEPAEMLRVPASEGRARALGLSAHGAWLSLPFEEPAGGGREVE